MESPKREKGGSPKGDLRTVEKFYLGEWKREQSWGLQKGSWVELRSQLRLETIAV